MLIPNFILLLRPKRLLLLYACITLQVKEHLSAALPTRSNTRSSKNGFVEYMFVVTLLVGNLFVGTC